MRWIVRLAAVAVMLAAGAGQAQAPPAKLALVVGNGGYATSGWALANPPRDARLIADRVRTLGFQTDLVIDADRSQMEQALSAFGAKLRGAGPDVVSFFYYAGHGVQVGGANYLVPVDSTATTLDRLRFQSPPMQFLLDDMNQAGNAVNILVLDACRNLPLPDGPRSLGGSGLADLGETNNFFIAYATAPGRTAADGTGENSPFAKALADAMDRQANDPIELLFSDINARVSRETNGGQSPEYRNGLVRAPRWSFGANRMAPAVSKRPGEVFRDCPECPEMVVIPAGAFVMGSPVGEPRRDEEEEQRNVTIGQSFAVSRFEVTFTQWDACAAAGGCADDDGPYRPADEGWGRGDRPVVNVSWRDAKRYVRWLNARVGGSAYRLLTEEEWEYAARGGTTTAFPWGGVADTDRTKANFYTTRTVPVGTFRANAFGLHDMHGNAGEWVEDCIYINGVCTQHRVRGGRFDVGGPEGIRSATRGWEETNDRSRTVGFRVARSIP